MEEYSHETNQAPLPLGGVWGRLEINARQDEIIEEFEELDDWMDRYQLLIDMGSDMEPLPEEYKTEQNLIDGCQSRVWLHAEPTDDGGIHFEAESDALIVKGIVRLLVSIFDGQKPEDILNADLYFIERIGLREHLSPTRSNGLVAMVRRIHDYARAYANNK